MESDYDATAALHDIELSRKHLADRVVTPVWYHPVLGLGFALLCMGCAYFDNSLIFWVLVPASILLSVVVANIYKRATGVWINWRHADAATRQVGYLFAVVVVIAVAVSALLGSLGHPLWALPVAGVAWVLTIVLGRAIDERLRAGIRAGRAGIA